MLEAPLVRSKDLEHLANVQESCDLGPEAIIDDYG